MSGLARLSPHLKGHLLLFDHSASLTPGSTPAGRLLLVFLVLEAVLGPRLSILRWLHVPALPAWIRIPALFAVALALLRFVARLEPAQIGFKGWRSWSAAERSYFIQTLILGNIVFMLLSARPLRVIASDPSLWGTACMVTLTSLAWGLYQELVYRGILQTALVSRLGPAAGILIANTVFTFGPLHFYHFAGASPVAMFVAIFAIGLYFGALRHRSGNLWMPAVFHGIGTAWILGA